GSSGTPLQTSRPCGRWVIGGFSGATNYPSQALQDGSAGSRIARLQLDVQGRVSAVTIVERQGSPDPRLDEAVVETLRQWRFEPALRDGHAVVSSVQVPVEFTDAR
ncbi:energy transducer TonB, partial [Xanthomonas campestris pv. campestris]|nr:energy transducer TonB [Xanthomonas campestris pv. campestris]